QDRGPGPRFALAGSRLQPGRHVRGSGRAGRPALVSAGAFAVDRARGALVHGVGGAGLRAVLALVRARTARRADHPGADRGDARHRSARAGAATADAAPRLSELRAIALG